MLKFVIGEKGAGKTPLLYRCLGEAAAQNEEALLLVPRQATFENDKGVLNLLGPQKAANVQVLSFSRLSELVFRQTGRPQRPLLGAGANTALMALALESVADRLEYFARHAKNFGFAQKMLSAVAFFKQSAITPPELMQASAKVQTPFLCRKLKETALIFEAYEALVAQSFFDDQDVLTLVAEKLPESGLLNRKTVVISGFSAFSAQEMEVLRKILCCAKEVVVGLCCDDLSAADVLSPFALTRQTARRLRRLAEQCGVPVAAPVVCSAAQDSGFRAAPELQHLAEHLFDPAAPVFKGESSALSLQFAPSRREECDFAALRIHALLRSGAYRCRDIAVVYSDADAYADEIRFSLHKYGVPVFEDHRAPVANEPLILLVRALLECRAEGLSTELLMRYLKTGLAGIDTVEIADAENYALLWDLSGADWQREWTANPDGFGAPMNEERVRRLEKLNEIRTRIISPLLAFRDQTKDADAQTVMAHVYDYLISHAVDQSLKAYAISLEEAGEPALALSQEQIWDCLMHSLDEIAGALGKRTVSAKLLLDVFCAVISQQSLGKLPDGYDEVTLCDKARMVTQTPRVVFVLGANAGAFPKGPADGALFSHDEARRLQAVLPALFDEEERRTLSERHLIYHALCSAKEKLVISWALTGSAGEKLEVSPLVKTLQQMFPGQKAERFDALSAEELCEAKMPAFELLSKRYRDPDAQILALKTYFSADESFGSRVRTLDRAAQKKAFAFESAKNAKTLFGETLYLSASQLEVYEECPFKYFCRYGLKAEPRKQAKLDPANSGTVVHYVLEHLLREHSGAEFKKLNKEDAALRIHGLLRQYIDVYMGGTEDKTARFLYLYERLEKTLVTVVERLLAEFSNSAFAPVGFEVKIGRGEAVKPYTVPLKDGRIELRGSIDRVDKMEKNGKTYIRVVDYKTGGKEFLLSDVLGGLSMQMLLYLVALWRDGSGDYKDMIPAGVLYLPANALPFDSERTDGAEEIERRRMDGGKMEGMLLDDSDVLAGMSIDGSLRFFPAEMKKGGFKGSLITLEQLGKLSRRMDRIMAEMGNALQNGQVPAKPVRGKTHGRTCEFCDFKAVCRREHGDSYRYLPKMKHEESLSALEGED